MRSKLIWLTVLVCVGLWFYTDAAHAQTVVPLWANVHRDGTGHPTSNQLAPFTDAAGWQYQEVAGPRWWRYTKGTRTTEANLPEQWYMHVDGQRVVDGEHHRLFVMNPEKRGWQLHVAPDCAIRCFLDGVGDGARRRTVPSITASWDARRWRIAVTEEIRLISNWGGTLLPNSAFSPQAVRSYASAAGRASTEGFFGLGDLPILEAGPVWVFGKVHDAGGCGSLLAAYLVGKGKGDHFSCFNLSNEPWDVPSELEGPRIGRPLGAAVRLSHGWKRRFTHGVLYAHDDGSWSIRR